MTTSRRPEARGAGLEVRESAARVLLAVERAGARASVLVDRLAARLSDPRDRALLREIVLGVLRDRAALDRAAALVTGRPLERLDPEVVATLRIGLRGLTALDRVPSHAVVSTAVEVVRRLGRPAAAGLVNAALRTAARDPAALRPPAPVPGDVEGLALRRGHAAWWTRRLVERLGWEAADAILAADNLPAPVVLRPNAAHPDAGALAARLRDEGVETAPSPWIPGALRVTAGVATATRAFASGAAYVQDEASQIVPFLAGTPGGDVVDACAAPGGKAFALAERLPAGAVVVAFDRSARRLARLVGNARRLGSARVAAVVADATRGLPLARPAAAVLVDAPCSGTGTLRRHPEIRWRVRETDLDRFAERQLRLLEAAAPAVAPAGRLVYSVCSLEPEEGEAVVARFLDLHSGFRPVDPSPDLPAACRRLVGADLAVRTTPAFDGLDGFYAVALSPT